MRTTSRKKYCDTLKTDTDTFNYGYAFINNKVPRKVKKQLKKQDIVLHDLPRNNTKYIFYGVKTVKFKKEKQYSSVPIRYYQNKYWQNRHLTNKQRAELGYFNVENLNQKKP
jgi:hypothetical protein